MTRPLLPVRELLAMCEAETVSTIDARILRARFRSVVTPAIFKAVGDAALDCEAFVLGSVDAAREADWNWPANELLRLGLMAAHFGHDREAAELAEVCRTINPKATDTLVFWAQSAATGAEVVDRFRTVIGAAEDRAAVERAALHFIEHSAERAELLRRWRES